MKFVIGRGCRVCDVHLWLRGGDGSGGKNVSGRRRDGRQINRTRHIRPRVIHAQQRRHRRSDTRPCFRSKVQCLECLTTIKWNITHYHRIHHFIGVILLLLLLLINQQRLGRQLPDQLKDHFQRVTIVMMFSQKNHQKNSE